jgi:small conductance mechanosensitive channel
MPELPGWPVMPSLPELSVPYDNWYGWLVSLLLRLGGALLVLWLGRFAARYAKHYLQQLLTRLEMTETVINLFMFATYYGLLGVAALIALGVAGVPAGAILSSVGVVVVVLGLALRESLGNLAATVIFLLFQPFKVGDLIESMGIIGTVQEIQLFNTVLVSPDNKVITLPNAQMQNSAIANYSRLGMLRVDTPVSISYTDDVQRAKNVLSIMLHADTRILGDPPPQVVAIDLGERGITLQARGFVLYEDFWAVRFEMPEKVKRCLEEAGIRIALPQRELYVAQGTPLALSRKAVTREVEV